MGESNIRETQEPADNNHNKDDVDSSRQSYHIHVRVEPDGRQLWVDSKPGEDQGWLACYTLGHLGGD